MRLNVSTIKKWMMVSLAFGALMAMGCATSGKKAPIGEIANVEMAINRAQESNADAYAPLELKFARDKFEAAKVAVNKKQFKKAKPLLEEALIDARLAEAKSRAEAAKKRSRDMRNSIEALRSEIQRAQ